jgi:Cof subfamily protein (haloacid dehalogenase superfamily)
VSDGTPPVMWPLGEARPLFRPSLVASDLDGTLLPPDFTVPAAPAAAIAALRAAGVPFVICTGRMFQSVRRVAAELGLHDGPVICYQGALVADLASGEKLLETALEPDMASDVVRTVRELGRHLNAYIDDELVVEDEERWTRFYKDIAGVGCTVVEDLLATVAARAPTKFIVTTDVDDVAVLLPRLQERWAGRLYVTRSQPWFIEITDRRATKSRALEFLRARLGADPRRTVACGDGHNDIDMLRWAALGVAVAESDERVWASADLVVARVDLPDLLVRLSRASS